MSFRNWKQEVEDKRPPRPSPWPWVLRGVAATIVLGGGACMALWVWPGFLLPKPWRRAGPVPPRVAVFFSSDVHGHWEPCGCTEQRWGGIARASGFLGQVNKPRTILRFDVGQMTAGAARWQQMGWAKYLRALGQMNYLAANLGATEAQLSAADLKRLAADSAVPLVSANLVDAGGAPIVAPYRQITVDHLRVTILGVAQIPAGRATGAGVTVADVDQRLGRLLPKLRGKTDLVILLASCDRERMRRIARAHPEIDLILGGRVRQASREIEQIGACRIAYHAKKGQMLGRVDLEIRPDGRMTSATSAMIVLDDRAPEDPAMGRLVEEYNNEMSGVVGKGGLTALGIAAASPPAGGNAYVGAGTCRSCHSQAYKVWKRDAHSRAYASLIRRGRQNNPACVRCHVVGLGAGDGFRGARQTPGRIDVQCESCHGRGGDHVRARQAGLPGKTGAFAPVDPQRCETCHDWIHSPEFVYDTYWERIKHGSDASTIQP